MISDTFGAEAIFPGASRSCTRSCWGLPGGVGWPSSTGSGRGPSRLRLVAWLFATLGDLGSPASDAPVRRLHAALGRRAGAADQHGGRDLHPAPAACAVRLAGLLGLLIVLAALSSGRQAVRKYRAASALPRTTGAHATSC